MHDVRVIQLIQNQKYIYNNLLTYLKKKTLETLRIIVVMVREKRIKHETMMLLEIMCQIIEE